MSISHDVQQVLNSTSNKLTVERAMWKFQYEYKFVDEPKDDCVYGFNDYDKLDVNRKNKYGRVALMFASWSNVEIVRILLEGGADPNIQEEDGKTALMYASYIGSDDVIKILLDYGADSNIKDKHGNIAQL